MQNNLLGLKEIELKQIHLHVQNSSKNDGFTKAMLEKIQMDY